MKQSFFKFIKKENYSSQNFIVSKSNSSANILLQNNFVNNIILKGPKKCGKTHLGLIWKNKNNAIEYQLEIYELIFQKKINIFIDNFFLNLDEEKMFHLVNHCFNNNLKILISTDKSIVNHKFKYADLKSRLMTFNLLEINEPDDELIYNLLLKLLYDRQIIIKNEEIFDYIVKRINRTYDDIYKFVSKIDKLSLEKKKKLTIPLIKELL